jgi:hypothetical protein
MDAGSLLLFWLIFSVIVAIAANGRGRSAIGWFLIAILLSPVLALIAVLVMAPGSANTVQPTKVVDVPPVAVIDPRKPCPDCGELVPVIARICRFCRYEFKDIAPSTTVGDFSSIAASPNEGRPVEAPPSVASIPSSATGLGAVDPAPSVVARSQSRNWVPALIVMLLLVAAGAGFYLWQRSMSPQLTVAENAWCNTSANGAAINQAADRLGIDRAEILIYIVDQQYGTTAASKITADWARVCDAAYSSR